MDVGERGEEESIKFVMEGLDAFMDTPERNNNNQITAKFEDSPIYNFLNSLSPIKAMKSVPITQTFNPLSFSSSVFTSPHVSSLRESSLSFRRNQLLDPSKPEFSSDVGNTIDTDKVNVDVTKKLDQQKENLDPRASNCEVACKPSYDCSKSLLNFAENFSGDGDNQNCSVRPGYACSSSAVGPVAYKNAENLEGFDHDQNKEATSCDWDYLISNATNVLVFESPNDIDSCVQSVDPSTSFYRCIRNAMQNEQTLGVSVSGEHFRDGSILENTCTQPGEVTNMMENVRTRGITAASSILNPNQKVDYENLSGLGRGIRRRSLFLDTGGPFRKHAASGFPMLLKSNENTSSEQQTALKKTENDSSRVLPGIGLHLNVFATTPKDIQIVNHEASASGRLLIGPSPSASFHLPTSSQELINNSLANYSLDRAIAAFTNDALPTENEESNPSSPRKKKRRLEQGGELESCKRCNCKKSKCLKLYCECFAAGVYCSEPCACIGCSNKPQNEDTVVATRNLIESRNPLAFTPKVIRGSGSLSEKRDDFSNTPASARHKRGCNCKKSGCLKKYCECYQGGVGCSINCRCEGCKNIFGRKDGTAHELEEDETNTTALHQSMDSAPLATPLRNGRQSIEALFSSRKRPPRSSFSSVNTSSSGSGQTSFFPPPPLPLPPPPPPKFKQPFEIIKEDQLPEFLQGGSPVSGVKSSSPNGKRVSPPKSLETPSGMRSNRKLILQSIPSFPSF